MTLDSEDIAAIAAEIVKRLDIQAIAEALAPILAKQLLAFTTPPKPVPVNNVAQQVLDLVRQGKRAESIELLKQHSKQMRRGKK